MDTELAKRLIRDGLAYRKLGRKSPDLLPWGFAMAYMSHVKAAKLVMGRTKFDDYAFVGLVIKTIRL